MELQEQENKGYPRLSWSDFPRAIADLEQVFKHMNIGRHVKQVAQNDPLIVCFGSELFTRLRDEEKAKKVIVGMRYLAKVLIYMKQRNNQIHDFQDCFVPCNFNNLKDCTKLLGKYDRDMETFYRPSVVLSLGKNLKSCANILRGEIMKDPTVPISQKECGKVLVNQFLFLMTEEWKYEMEKFATTCLNNRLYSKFYSDSADVALAFNYIMCVYDSLISKIKARPTSTNYAALAKHCIAHIMILNGCWPGEITRALLEHYQVKDANEIPIEQRSRLWTDKEKEQVGDILFFQVPGRVKREVSCFLTKKMKEAVDTLIATRNTLNITSDYLFARPSTGNYLGKYEFYNGTHIIDEFNTVLKDQLKDAENFTAAGVRAYVEYQRDQAINYERSRTYLQTFLFDETTALWVSNFSEARHSEGNNKDDSDTDDDSDSCDKEYRFPLEEDSGTPITRVQWTDEEKEVLYKHFGKHLLELRQPPRQDIKDIVEMEPALINRTLNQVCSYINNIVTQKTKLPPSAVRWIRQRYS